MNSLKNRPPSNGELSRSVLPCLIALLVFLGIALFWQGTGWTQDAQVNSCVECHSDIAEENQGSIHAQQGISCQDCHGGDPSQKDKDAAKAPGTGYIGIPDKKQIVQVCGTCHADVEKMNFYGIRTDQLARYKTSLHGKKLLQEGDTHVAACSDCHGYHNILRVTDPNSPAYPLNVPKTCNRCHGNEKLMGSYQLPSDIFRIYEGSVHGKALFEKKDISVAQCASCHGSHGAIPPGVKQVGNACGKCHLNEYKYFSESVHAKLSEGAKFSECVSCHGNHGVSHPAPALYAQACALCHEPQSPEFQLGHRLEDLIATAQKDLSGSEELAKEAAIEGYFVEQETASLEQMKTIVLEMGPLQHTLDEAKISDRSQKVHDLAKEVADKIDAKRKNKLIRKYSLIPIWIFILVMVVSLWAKFKELKKGLDGSGSEHDRH